MQALPEAAASRPHLPRAAGSRRGVRAGPGAASDGGDHPGEHVAILLDAGADVVMVEMTTRELAARLKAPARRRLAAVPPGPGQALTTAPARTRSRRSAALSGPKVGREDCPQGSLSAADVNDQFSGLDANTLTVTSGRRFGRGVAGSPGRPTASS